MKTITTSYSRLLYTFPQVNHARRVTGSSLALNHYQFRTVSLKCISCFALQPSNKRSEGDVYFTQGATPEAVSLDEWSVLQRVCDRLFPPGATDWEEFWMRDDFDEWCDDWWQIHKEEGGMDPAFPQYEPTIECQRAWLKRATAYLKTRRDYAVMLPMDWKKGSEEESETNYAKEFDPEWDDWDFRAMMEKRRRREESRRAWKRKQKLIGLDRHVDTISLDVRIPEEDREAYDWTEEEIWDLITQNGRAVDPRKLKKTIWKEMNPDEPPDLAAEGHEYVEEIDDYMIKKGLMIDNEAALQKTEAELELDSKVKEIDDLFDT